MRYQSVSARRRVGRPALPSTPATELRSPRWCCDSAMGSSRVGLGVSLHHDGATSANGVSPAEGRPRDRCAAPPRAPRCVCFAPRSTRFVTAAGSRRPRIAVFSSGDRVVLRAARLGQTQPLSLGEAACAALFDRLERCLGGPAGRDQSGVPPMIDRRVPDHVLRHRLQLG